VKIKFIQQEDAMDCGPACIAMVASFYGKELSLSYLRQISQLTKEGISLLSIDETGKKLGFETACGQFDLEYLLENFNSPCILHWNNNHFVVLTSIKRKKNGKPIFTVYDPAFGKIELKQENFEFSWISAENAGFGVFLTPTEDFFNLIEQKKTKLSISKFFAYIKPNRRKFLIVLLLMLLGNVISLAFPFLTKSLIDKGVNSKNTSYITNILLAQLTLYSAITIFDIFRNRLTLYISSKIGIQIIMDFLSKLFKLPINFFESRMNGDLQQRISDNDRIQEFLTNQGLITIFSLFTLLIYLIVLPFFGVSIFFVYLILTLISLIWSFFWLRKRRKIDYLMFQLSSKNYESLSEIISGVSEMKLNNFEEYKQTNWKKIQDEFLEVRTKRMKLEQIQHFGYDFINQTKNILVVFIAANLVATGDLTLGSLLSVSSIIGLMNGPIGDIIEFSRSLQEANLSYSRLEEIQTYDSEERDGQISLESDVLSEKADIKFENVSFQYEGINSPTVLKNVNFTILGGKTTAIVGTSGSGKTTLIKLLLKYYSCTEGVISINGLDLNCISAKNLRSQSGVVMQDGFIFSETLYRNIVMGCEEDDERFKQALKIANLESFVADLPLEENTKLGSSGNGISGGQKQRILIARAAYKKTQFIFLDEATSSLDSENERVIHENINKFFKNKTVVVVAHRLSTVKNADQIIVLEKGEIIEIGDHDSLVKKQGAYFNLVKNQLELGN
jgi:ATP-binding cassette subfamily B protein